MCDPSSQNWVRTYVTAIVANRFINPPPRASVRGLLGNTTRRQHAHLVGAHRGRTGDRRLPVAGPKASYEFHARSSDGRVKDASATSPAPASVTVTVLANNDTGIADAALLATVARALNAEDVRPLGDRLSVQAAQVINYQIEATLFIGVGPKVPILLDAVRVSQPRRPLGHSIYRSACSAAAHVEGVRKVVLTSPAADIELNATQAARCTAIKLNVVVSDE
ncbi:baseplate assembly protein [Janthinobacterium sp. PSPC1-1]|uniref:baseplate assembly protein n=1 Tax=Janthinobacterium sp. PSPC1-1 TaxID=2804581 RepID=UPI003CFBA812